jgi:hypothetical protein
MEGLFTRPDAWAGGSFELLIQLEEVDASAVRAALTAIWAHPTLEGCWLNIDTEPADQLRVSPGDESQCLHGIATLPNRTRVACDSLVVRDDRADWIYFGVPMGSLGHAYPVGAYPFEDGLPTDWRLPVSEWLRAIGEHTFATVKFRLGLIGWLLAGDVDAEEFAAHGLPEERWAGYLVPTDGRLKWYPSNQPSAPMTAGKRGGS